MPKLLFIDDEPYNLELAIDILTEVIEDCSIVVKETAHDSIQWLSENTTDLIIMDIFLPLGQNLQETLGPRANEYADHLKHLGGIAILGSASCLLIKLNKHGGIFFAPSNPEEESDINEHNIEDNVEGDGQC